jgi:hypothetical protein
MALGDGNGEDRFAGVGDCANARGGEEERITIADMLG